MDERKIMCALTKIESLTTEQLSEKKSIVKRHGYSSPLAISVHQEIGLEGFQDAMLKQLFGKTVTIKLINSETGRSIEGYLSDVYESSMIIDKQLEKNGDILVEVWINQQSLARLVSNSNGRIEVK